MAEPVHGLCWKIAHCLKLDAVYDGKIVSQRNSQNRPDIGGLSREVKQEVSALKCLGISLMSLTLVYIGMSIVNLSSLSHEKFASVAEDKRTAKYSYTKHLNYVKVAHSCILFTLTVPIAFLTVRRTVNKKKRYNHLLCLTMIALMCYIIPLVFYINMNIR